MVGSLITLVTSVSVLSLCESIVPVYSLNVNPVTSDNFSSSSSRNRQRAYRDSVNASIDRIFQRQEPGRRPCETEQIEYRLTKLEVQVAEKAENLRSELREGNRRLQAVEWQSGEVQRTLEGYRNELGRLAETQQPLDYAGGRTNNNALDKLEVRLDNLAKGVQLVVAALRGLKSDVTWIRRNLTELRNATNVLLQGNEQLVTKEFLSNGLLELKYGNWHPNPPAATCPLSSQPSEATERLPKNCKEAMDKGNTQSGIYRIQPSRTSEPFMVLCDMQAHGGGWTYIQNRYDGSQDFYLNWHNYKHGFGNLGGEFWLGLEHIYQLTGHEVNELLIELMDHEEQRVYARYAAFSIGSQVEGYRLKILGGYSGTAGDSLTYHAGSKFSTKDLDQDGWPEGSCAQSHGGAWWYRECDTSNLNGKYLNGQLPDEFLYQGMYWGEFRGPQYSLRQARILIKPRDNKSAPLFPNGVGGVGKTMH